jgi:hypothetical protein
MSANAEEEEKDVQTRLMKPKTVPAGKPNQSAVDRQEQLQVFLDSYGALFRGCMVQVELSSNKRKQTTFIPPQDHELIVPVKKPITRLGDLYHYQQEVASERRRRARMNKEPEEDENVDPWNVSAEALDSRENLLSFRSVQLKNLMRPLLRLQLFLQEQKRILDAATTEKD